MREGNVMNKNFIPRVDDITDNSLEGPFKLEGSRYIQLILDEDKIDEDILTIQVTKNSFINQLKVNVKYINYFIKYFDEDDELISGYLIMLFMIKNRQLDFDMEQFHYHLISIFTAESFLNKIVSLVKHNLEGTKLKPPGKKIPNEAIQITEEHFQEIMALAIMHKCIIPIISCFYNLRKKEVRIDDTPLHEKDFYFLCLTAFIPAFDKIYEVDLYSKLYYTTGTRTSKTKKDQAMWERRRSFGSTPVAVQSKLMKDLFVDLSQKAIFNKNIINLIHVSFDKTIKNHLIQKDKVDIAEISQDESESEDNATQFDILQMNNAKFSIEDKNRAKILIDSAIDDICDKYDIKIREEDIEFYKRNYKLNNEDKTYTPSAEVQVNLIFLFFSKYVKSYHIMSYVKPKQFLKLLIIFKEVLQRTGYRYIPHLVSGDIDRVSSKRFNKNKLEKLITSHALYEDLAEDYTFLKGQISKKKFIENLRDLVTTRIYIVDHNFPEMIHDKTYLDVTDSYEVIADEIVRFLLSI